MLNNSPVSTSIPVEDLERAKKFYTDTLGLSVDSSVTMTGMALLTAGKGSKIMIYERGPTQADHTVAMFDVESVEKEVDELISKGVTFEQYDMEYIKTDDKGISLTDDNGGAVAWFKDTEGNILGISGKR